jgi:glutaminyl-peptide cyclotransferase
MPLFQSLLSLLLTVASVLAYTSLSNNSLLNLPSTGNDFDIRNGALLAPILRPRVPGTPDIEEVRLHFVNFFQQNLPNWRISYQNSTQNTALRKRIFFSNLIMSRDPPWAKPGDVGRLTLVAHYDSKISPKGFIGATDSAAPCAMLMHVARSIDEGLTRKWSAMQQAGQTFQQSEKGIQVIFLDGEEAFVDWTAQDSVYGAR